jgi:hypothetical protein
MDLLVMLALTLFALVVMTILMPTLGRVLYDLLSGQNSELGGYVHDTSMSQWIPPTAVFGDTAAWSLGAGQVSNSIVYKCDATDETANLFIPIPVPSNSAASKGAYLKSIEVDYEIVTAACDTVTPVIYKMTRGADGADVVVATPAFTYDAGHDTDDERDDLDEHKMTLTITTPFWLDNDEYVWLAIAFDKAGTSTVEFLGAVANYTLRL